MNKLFFGVLVSWSCWAQPVMTTPERIKVEFPGGSIFRTGPLEMPPPEIPQERPTGQSISVSQLQHKISKEAGRAYKHARKLSRAGEHGKAAADLETVVQRDPEFSQAQNQLGVEYAYLGRWEEAEIALRESLKLEPASWSAHYNLGLVLYGKGDLPGAEQSTRRALQFSSQNPQAHLFLGYLLLLRAETRAQGLQEVKFAARTMTAARRLLRTLEAR